MSWSEQKANERVDNNSFETEDIEVLDLSKEMNFENLGPKDVRRGEGVHIYVDVCNFNKVVEEAKNDTQKQKKYIRAASVLRKVQTEILQLEDIARLQLQATRLHAFGFKPYDDEKHRSEKALTCAIHMNTYISEVFNDVFSELTDFHCSVGMAAGETLIANVGARGDRELISLGSPANLGAKILGKNGTIRITQAIHDSLPKEVAALFTKLPSTFPEEVYEALNLTWQSHPELLDILGAKFSTERWKNKTEEYRDGLPLSEIDLSDAKVKIDIELLTEKNCKRINSVVLFADLDGFTQYVQQAEEDDEVVELVRKLHMIRAEFDAIATQDFDGVVIQHRGDCMLAIVHLPTGENEEPKRAKEAVNLALGLQSSMEHVLTKYLGDRKGIHVALGLDHGSCIVSRFGKQGDREVVCLGVPVDAAEELQQKTKGQDIRISKALYAALPDSEAKIQFSEMKDKTFLMKSMTFPRLKEIEIGRATQKGAINMSAVKGGFMVETVSKESAPSHLKMNPWLSK